MSSFICGKDMFVSLPTGYGKSKCFPIVGAGPYHSVGFVATIESLVIVEYQQKQHNKITLVTTEYRTSVLEDVVA